MSRIPPLTPEQLPPERRAAMDKAEQLMGFVSNDSLTMARDPALMDAFGALVRTIYAPGQVDAGLKRLIGMMTSAASGCEYCTGHTAFASRRQGVSDEKLAAIWDFENSPLFSPAEKAALRVALSSGQTPNAVDDEMFAAMAGHYDEAAQLEIVSVIALFGFLNRWNSTLKTNLESLPSKALEKSRVG